MPVAEGFSAMSVRVPDDLKAWLDKQAIKEFSSVNRLICVILEQERERRQGEEN